MELSDDCRSCAVFLEPLLHSILLPNCTNRQECESAVHGLLASSPDVAFPALGFLVGHSQAPEIRQLSSVVLRRSIQDRFEQSPNLLGMLLQSILQESIRPVRLSIALAFAELASSMIYEPPEESSDASLEILARIRELCINKNSPGIREAGFSIIDYIADCLSDVLPQEIQKIGSWIDSGLEDPEFSVRVGALKAFTSIVGTLTKTDDEAITLFREIFSTKVFPVLEGLLNSRESAASEEILSVLIAISSSGNMFFQGLVDRVVGAMSQIASASMFDDGIRQLALEFIITLAESDTKAFRDNESLVGQTLTLIFHLMLFFEEDLDQWNSDERSLIHSEEALEECSIFEYALESLDRFSQTVGRQAISKSFFFIFNHFLQNNDWKYLYVALMGLSQVGEVLSYENIREVSPWLMQQADKHSQPRVQYAAIHCIGQICTDFGPTFQQEFHSEILHLMIHKLAFDVHHRIQSHAAAAIVNFSEHAKFEMFGRYLEPLLSSLFDRLKNGVLLVQQQVLTCVAAIADAIREHFSKFYGIFVPHVLKLALDYFPDFDSAKGCSTDEFNSKRPYLRARSKAFECFYFMTLALEQGSSGDSMNEIASFVANTVSQVEQMINYASIMEQKMNAKDIVKFFLVEDSSLVQLMLTWLRLIPFHKSLYSDFLPRLVSVCFVILQLGQGEVLRISNPSSANVSPSSQLFSSEDSHSRLMELSSSVSQELRVSATLLCNLMQNFPHQYAPMVEITYNQLQVFFHGPGIPKSLRKAAISCIPFMVKSLLSSDNADKAVSMLEKLIQLIHYEGDPSSQCYMIQSIYLVLNYFREMNFVALIDYRIFESIISSCIYLGSISANRCDIAEKSIQSLVDDYEDLDDNFATVHTSSALKIENELIQKLIELLYLSVLISGSHTVNPVKKEQFQSLVSMINSASVNAVRIGFLLLGMIAEISNTSELFFEFSDIIYPVLLNLLEKNGQGSPFQLDLAFALIFATGHFGLCQYLSFDKYFDDAVRILTVIVHISSASAIGEGSFFLRDRAAAAFGKVLLKKQVNSTDNQQLFDELLLRWISMFPFHIDQQEAYFAYNSLLMLLETYVHFFIIHMLLDSNLVPKLFSEDSRIYGSPKSEVLFEAVSSVFKTIYDTPFSNENLRSRISVLVARISRNLPS